MSIRFRKSLFPLLDYQNIIITITIITIPIIIMIIAPMIIVKFRQRMALPLPSLPERGRGFSHSILHTLAPGTYFFYISLSPPFFSLCQKYWLFHHSLFFAQIGKPMYYMETALGQYARLSPLQVPADKYKQHHHRASSYHHSPYYIL